MAVANAWDPLLEDDRVTHQGRYEARSARLVEIPDELNSAVRDALAQAGITGLYAHQDEALRAAFEGPTVVTTGTASGKSLCFQLPTLQTLIRPRRWRRTRPARSTHSVCISRSARRSTTATRRVQSARRSVSART